MSYDLEAWIMRQRRFSERTFGPGDRTKGISDHIQKELKEIEADPKDVKEWIDIAILAFDQCWRLGYTPEEICAAFHMKQAVNMRRKWPDWRKFSPDEAIEHIRTDGDKV